MSLFLRLHLFSHFVQLFFCSFFFSSDTNAPLIALFSAIVLHLIPFLHVFFLYIFFVSLFSSPLITHVPISICLFSTHSSSPSSNTHASVFFSFFSFLPLLPLLSLLPSVFHYYALVIQF